ncbi:uncharacterized protein LOC118613345 [Rousettus aegyptiacus]|uniref:uncharacterized protein LOC118613345 n=1 Tax=Rousettus aegyptiacus TaxID=9407 RepID=UPI00168D631D|nr:uncharacterized protein LOC118613345 [Rousettus aegyptiacus]
MVHCGLGAFPPAEVPAVQGEKRRAPTGPRGGLCCAILPSGPAFPPGRSQIRCKVNGTRARALLGAAAAEALRRLTERPRQGWVGWRRGSFPTSSCPPSGTDFSNSQQLMGGACEQPAFCLATPRPSTGTVRDHPKRSGRHLLMAEKNNQNSGRKLLQLHRVRKYSRIDTPRGWGQPRRGDVRLQINTAPEGDGPVCASRSGGRTLRGEGAGRGGSAGHARQHLPGPSGPSARLPRPHFPFPQGPLHATLPAVDSGKCPGGVWAPPQTSSQGPPVSRGC